jgi:hypothetical protein
MAVAFLQHVGLLYLVVQISVKRVMMIVSTCELWKYCFWSRTSDDAPDRHLILAINSGQKYANCMQ